MSQQVLAAILATDMVGYSRHMARDEAGTITRKKAHERELFSPLIEKFNGRIVKNTGDGLLVTFNGLSNAVECAVQAQRDINENSDEADNNTMHYRMGINLGEIIVDEDGDIFGNGVNIAARLESIAEPGGICISDAVFQNLRSRFNISFADMGETALKNIEPAVRVWRWLPDQKKPVPVTGSNGSQPQEIPAVAPLPLPSKPSIAILAFKTLSGDLDTEFLADGMVEDLITELSRDPLLFVIARNSSFAYKGSNRSIVEIGEELGVRYVLQGSLRKSGDRIRLSVQLIDAKDDVHVWAERMDRTIDDVFAVQDELTAVINSKLLNRIANLAYEQSRRFDPAKLDAYQLTNQAYVLSRKTTRADIEEGLELVKRALELDPEYGRAHMVHSWMLLHRAGTVAYSDDPVADFTAAQAAARRAIELDERDFWGYAALGASHLWLGRPDLALPMLEKSIAQAPSNADALAFHGLSLSVIGDYETALDEIEKAVRLNPMHPDWYLMGLGRVFYLLDRFEEAAFKLNQLADRKAEYLSAQLMLIASLIAAGEEKEAKRHADDLLDERPGFTLHVMTGLIFFLNQQERDLFQERLLKAGIKAT